MTASVLVWRVSRDEDAFPPQLIDLDRAGDVEDAPDLLYGCGQTGALAALDIGETVTIVGSRRATAYGTAIATGLARDLASAGVTIVSGLAYGIDSAAHRGALDAGGTTVAVLAGGPDVAQPPSSLALYRRIASSGAVISERAPGAIIGPRSFPVRNRIMAALAKVTVVVEAAQRSGSTVTARQAEAIGRTVGAVPGPVTSRASSGTNELIRDGALCVTSAEDVLDLLYGVGARFVSRTGPPLEPELERVLLAVESGAGSPDAVAAATDLGGREVAIALTRLELVGYVASGPTGLYARTALQAPSTIPS
jgi:DNA processing protein